MTFDTTDIVLLVGAGLATIGWIYTARRNRVLSRKQHTFNVLLHMSFNDVFLTAFREISPHIRKRNLPKLTDDEHPDLRHYIKLTLNHYEFLAAGVRNGDLDERLLRDSERSVVINFFEGCQQYIYAIRDSRQRMSSHEHLEWLYQRWKTKPPPCFQRTCEWALGRPWRGQLVKTDGGSES